MKLILVDDEQIVLTGISTILETDKDRFTILAQCGSGFEALEAVARQRPDVVITDIRMSGMTGLELAERIKEIDEHILVILLTGYPDFVFAQKALTLGVFDYLVKPTRYTDIIKCLDRAEAKLQSRKNESAIKLRLVHQLENNWETLASKFLQDVMKGFITAPAHIGEKARQLGIDIHHFVLINVKFKAWNHNLDKNIRDSFSLNYALRNMFGEVFGDVGQPIFVLESINNFVLLLGLPDKGDPMLGRVSACAGKCLRLALELLETHLVIGLSEVGSDLSCLRTACDQTLVAMETAAKTGVNFVCYGQDNDKNGVYSPAIKKALAYIHEHYCEDISLKLVSQQVFLNTWYFSELFKKEVGKSFTDYMLNLRIGKAKSLIEDKKLPLYQIAYMVGINGPGYFSQVFRRLTGMSPKEYRKEALKRS